MLRILAYVAALVALAALGAAVGDFASDPNPLGAFGLLLLVVLMGAAFVHLFRPGGIGSTRPAPERGPKPEKAPRRRAPGAPQASKRRGDERRGDPEGPWLGW